MKTTLRLENENGAFEVTVPKDQLTIKEMIEELVRPILRAAGYIEKNIIDNTGREHD